MSTAFTPPHAEPAHAGVLLRERGYVVLAPRGLAALMGRDEQEAPLAELGQFWSDLPLDAHLRDGGRYRYRRHASCVVEGGALRAVPHRAHWQPVDYNALHGGIERWFEPLQEGLVEHPVWARLLLTLTEQASALRGAAGPWYVEAHAFRITTDEGIGRPTPEGAHRDGVDMVAVILMDRANIKGGETRVFEANGPNGQRFTMSEPGTTLLIDDACTIHETTPIQPEDPARPGHRDTLVLTWRLAGFQDP
ncbi:MAG: 2OG-Fe dioxygenase family protein [Planctomycetota bacterium]